MTDESDLKQKEKDEALQRRKEELEDELDRYARAGAFSPGLIKFTRWLSRGLYLAMAVAFMVMLFNGWGKVSEEEFDRVHEGYTKWKKEAENEKTARTEAEGKLIEAEIRAAKLKLELEGKQDDSSAIEADRAQKQARDLVERAWGERAYAEHWRAKLKTEGEAGGAEAVKALIEQAARAPAGQRAELMRETGEFGSDAIKAAATTALESPDAEARKVAVRLLSRVGQSVNPKARGEQDEGVLREMWFSVGLVQVYGDAVDTYFAEAFVGMGFSQGEWGAKLDPAYRNAPEERRVELLALMAECVSRDDTGVFKMVATSQRPLAEKIIAVRWMGRYGQDTALLKTLSEGQGTLADEAKKALK